MGKTLARQRKKAAAAVELAAQSAVKKPESQKGAPNSMTDSTAKLSALVNSAFEGKNWNEALKWLAVLTKKQKVPKLGSVQRWVRFADLAGEPSLTASLLDAILRASGASSSVLQDGSELIDDGSGPIKRHVPWSPPAADPKPEEVAAAAGPRRTAPRGDAALTCNGGSPAPAPHHFKAQLQVVTFQPAHERVPPSTYDLTIWGTVPGTIKMRNVEETSASRFDVPFVPGAFVMTNVLSRYECAQIVAAAECMGYQPDVDYTFSPGVSGLDSAARNLAGGERAHGVVWLADDSLQGPIYERCRPHLPQELAGGALAGLNCRWRLYRYPSGGVYRPHVDGAWPGSGMKDGKYVFDAFGDRWSRLTFLIYLNEDFEGGTTTFYGPGPTPGTLDARSVKPRVGNVLCFPHGDTAGSLVHEGANVEKGTKYVIRTDVLYMLPKKGKPGR